MLFFLDTEFTDFIDCELISLGVISEDGRHELYLEVQDFDRTKCNPFVRAAVEPQLGKVDEAKISRSALQDKVREWFSSLPRSVTIACDSQHDRDLLADALNGEWPCNFSGWFDLRPLIDTGVFNRAVECYHTPEKPWHHALYDAQAHRAGWLAWMNANEKKDI